MRHRAATDIANSGVPIKIGMALTAHKTVTMFMRYVHTEDDPIRAAAETVAARRKKVVGGAPDLEAATQEGVSDATVSPITIAPSGPAGPRSPVHPGPTKTAMGNYRPYRGRRDENRSAPTKPAERVDINEQVQHV